MKRLVNKATDRGREVQSKYRRMKTYSGIAKECNIAKLKWLLQGKERRGI